MSRYVIEEADYKDDQALRNILSSNIIDGQICLSFEKNPAFFDALKVQGTYNQVITARDTKTGKVIGFGTRSVKPAYINGKEAVIGYLGNLRLERPYRKLNLLNRGYKYLKDAHHADNRNKLYLTTIIKDNSEVINTLVGKRGDLPFYHYYGDYYTFAVFLSKKKRYLNRTYTIVKGTEDMLPDIVDFLHVHGKRKQFFPYYTCEDFLNDEYLKAFDTHNLYIAFINGKIAGVLGVWDQTGFKQTIIRGYTGKMKWLNPLYNIAFKLSGYSTLPSVDSQLNYFCLSFIAIENDDTDVFFSLLSYIYEAYKNNTYSLFLIGLYNTDPLCRTITRFPHMKYVSRLYLVYWEDGESCYRNLDSRIPYVELASL